MPMENELHLTDLIDVEMLQRIQDAFSDMTGIASVTTDADGVAVTKGSHFSDFCMKYTRSSPLGCQRCELCDKNGAELALKKGASSTYFCHAGLVDFAAPIIADGRMVGCFIGGQVLTEPPDISKIMQVADELGVDPASYIQAVMKVNIVEKSQIDKAASFLYTIANGLSNIAYHKYQLFQANIEIEKANRMKSDFLANMSHEIRTPMNAVIGMAEMALREDLPPAARDYITQIKASGKTLLTIINDILDFSKIESGKMNIIPVEYEPMSTIHDVANIITTRIGSKNVELILDIAPDIPYKLFGDSIRFKQILLNLANNAVKFTKHGRVLLKIYADPVENGETVLHASIEDTGIGIKKEQIGRLFRSFEQLDSKRNRNIEGTGLGLAISKLLLTLMHGTISVESEYGIGSTFSFTLPQKVLDDRPSGVFNNDPPVHAALFIKNSLVQEQLQKDLDRLHIAYDNCTVTGTEPDNTPDYLFIDYAVFSSAMQDYIPQIQINANLIARMDCLLSFAKASDENRYVRPVIDDSQILDIKQGRHPVIETQLPLGERYVPNDVLLDTEKQQVMMITGPNMAGKSTYMRQTALIVLMAQVGSFVPAASANIGICDRIFTRVGASDDLASGQSTFMVEMSEVANILRNATKNSLLILDEIGRGTSTYDGLAIAWAVVEYISNSELLGAKTLFATHYHELTELEGKLSAVNNYCIAVKEDGDDIVFLRKIVKGGADRSYGIQVAKLAGVPDVVIARANEICNQLIDKDITTKLKEIKVTNDFKPKKEDTQMSMFGSLAESQVIEDIKCVDLSNMTPMKALLYLNELQERLK